MGIFIKSAFALVRSFWSIAIREVALRANSSPPVEDVTITGDMTIDRLRHTVSVDGGIRLTKPREFALLETLARRPSMQTTATGS